MVAVESKLQLLATSSAEMPTAAAVTADVPHLGARRRKAKTRLRSRNAFIDAALEETGECNDSYADLEDWIVVPKGRRYL